MDFMMTFFTDCYCLSFFGYHHHFPEIFPFQIFYFIDMMKFKRYIGFTTQFTDLCGQSALKSCSRACMNDCIILYHFIKICYSFALHKIRKSAIPDTFFGLIRNFPTAVICISGDNFSCCCLVLTCDCFQTTVFHKISKIAQSVL